jgi:hypothetical protein
MEIPRCEEQHNRAHCESADRRSKIAQILLPRNKVKDALIELHGRSSGGHLGAWRMITPTTMKNCLVKCGFSYDHVSRMIAVTVKLVEEEEDRNNLQTL